MAIIKCVNGHYYDDVKYNSCPHCGGAKGVLDDSKTISLNSNSVSSEKAVKSAFSELIKSNATDDSKTISYFQKKLKTEPVVGWIVCVTGPEKGSDFRLHSGRNFIGRSSSMDVVVIDDKNISRENHCSVIYDPKSNSFKIAPGESGNTYVNGEILTAPAEIAENDIIKLGESEFAFVAYCKGDKKWL